MCRLSERLTVCRGKLIQILCPRCNPLNLRLSESAAWQSSPGGSKESRARELHNPVHGVGASRCEAAPAQAVSGERQAVARRIRRTTCPRTPSRECPWNGQSTQSLVCAESCRGLGRSIFQKGVVCGRCLQRHLGRSGSPISICGSVFGILRHGSPTAL